MPTTKMTISDSTPAATTVSTRLRPWRLVLSIALTVTAFSSLAVAQTPGTSSSSNDAIPDIVVKVKLNVDPENATIYQVSPDGTSAPLTREGDKSIVELKKGTSFLLTAPLWGGGQFPELDKNHNPINSEQREPFTIHLDAKDLRKGEFPLDGSRIKRPWPAWVYAQAWTLGHPILAFGGVFGFLVLLGFAFRGALAGRLAKARPEKEASIAGDYSLLKKIGEGGMGEVWAASSAKELPCALKFIKKELAEDPIFKQRLEREIKICLPLRHRNLLKLYGYGLATDGRMYTVSELLEGKTLKEVISAGHYDPPQLASKVIEEVGDALEYLHTRRLVHRDVKPDNIFVCNSGEMKLMDMGLLRGEAQATIQVTGTGQMLGTPAYMPPEQMGTSGFGGFADQYSMGIILYEILAGQRPFTQPDALMLAYQHMHAAPEPPTAREPRIPADTEAAVLRMIAKKPEDRFPSMKDAQAAFESLRFTTWRDVSEETQAGTLRKPQ